MFRPRLVHVVLAATGFAAIAVGATGTLLLSRYRAAALAAIEERQALLVDASAHLIDDELTRLVAETSRLSRLAEVDLADGNVEPEKRVLRIARRDTVLFSAAIAIVDAQGDLVWSEPEGRAPASPLALVGQAQGLGRAVVAISPGEIDVAAPIPGSGAIVGIVSGRGGDLFGRSLQAAVAGGGEAELRAEGARVTAIGSEVPPELWAEPSAELRRRAVDRASRRWLLTEARLTAAPLTLRLAQPLDVVTASNAAPLRSLWILVGGAVAVAVGGGGLLAFALGRVEQADEEVRRSRELAAVGRTAAAIAHEVKNSLNGLSVALDLLASGRAPVEAAKRVHAQARAEIERLRGVAEDLTLFAATPRLALGPVDLAGLCRRTAGSCADLAADVGAEVELALPAAAVTLRGDEGKLLSALLNLARNGLEAMGPGAYGERLGSPRAAHERRLTLGVACAAGEAVVTVADTGAGLAPEVRAHLFEPFVSTKRTGTGLGLAIARRVVEAHGGRIGAEPRPGGGTVFHLALPLGGPGVAGEESAAEAAS